MTNGTNQARATTEGEDTKPVVVITGAAGAIGTALTQALRNDYFVVALDSEKSDEADASYTFDLTRVDSVKLVLREVATVHGKKIAAVVHLAAYCDFTGNESPLYDKVNVKGTQNLLMVLRDFSTERFIYASTMLVHQPTVPGHNINEQTPIGPRWVYPQSIAETEAIIRKHAGRMPYTLLRLAGLYDDQTCVPTLAHQIARIYEQNLKNRVNAGSTGVGQAWVHKEDLLDAFRRTIDRRHRLPRKGAILIGEERSETDEALQNRLGELIHGAAEWATLIPGPVAKTGAPVKERAEPVIRDDFDHDEKPFVRPFVIELANGHYDLDIRHARDQLGWEPRNRLFDTLPVLVKNLKADPQCWYENNGITPPGWLAEACKHGHDPEQVLAEHQAAYRQQHARPIWAHVTTMALALWLLMSPSLLGYTATGLAYSDWGAGLLLLGFAGLSVSLSVAWVPWVPWVCGGIGLWVIIAPLLFWTDSAAAYLNSTLLGLLVIGLAVATIRPRW